MKTVAVRFNEDELEDITRAFEAYLKKIPQYRQRADGLELVSLWVKLTSAARETGSYVVEDLSLPKWAAAKVIEALTTAGKVDELKAKIETLEARAKARGVTSPATSPAAARPSKKRSHKAKPKPAPAVSAPAPAEEA